MKYDQVKEIMLEKYEAEESTLMKKPCLRYKGDFFAMFYDKVDGIVIKLDQTRAIELINQKIAQPFNITKKQFKEWVVIPKNFENNYLDYILEAYNFIKQKKDK